MANQTLAQTGALNAHPITVSIIINNYNYGSFLRDAIDSALSQTYAHVEVIVVDDGSSDNSREIIGSYGDRVTPVFKQNGGQASAFNAGFVACTGDLVFFLDADDMLLPTAAETTVREWRGGLVRLRFPLEMTDGAGTPLGKLVEDPAPISPRLWPFSLGSPTSGNVFSREVLEKIMPIPEEDWRICADMCLTSASALFGDTAHVRQPLGRYRVHGTNNFAGAGRGLFQVRGAVARDFKLYSFLSSFPGCEIAPFVDWVGSYPQHWVNRIVSFRASPGDHPWPDKLFTLTRRALSAVWHHPYWNVRRRVAYTILIIGYCTMPKGITNALKSIEGRARAPVLRRLLGS